MGMKNTLNLPLWLDKSGICIIIKQFLPGSSGHYKPNQE